MISARLPGEGLTLGRRYTSAAAAPAPEFLPPAPPPPAAPAYPPVPGPGAYARFLSHAHGTHPFAYAPPTVSTAVAAPNAYRGAPYVAPPRARTSPGFAPPALSPSNHRRIAVERAYTERIQAERAQAERAQTERTQTESAHAEHSHASPGYFKRGALIRLEGGALRRVEEMRTEDFVASAERNSALTLSECTVLRLEERVGSLDITLSYNHNRSQVEMETTPEHPFFVYGQGWASCNPTRTLALYDLHVRRLRVGDVCVSLVQCTAGAGGAPSPPPHTQLCRTTTCPTTATGTAVSARLQAPLHTNQNYSQNSLQSSHSSQGLLLTSQSSLHASQSLLHTSQNTVHTSHNFFHTPQGPLYTSHSPLHTSNKPFHPPMGSVHSSQGSGRATQGLIPSAQVPIEASHHPLHGSSAYVCRVEPMAVQCYPENLSTKEDSRKRRWSAPDKCQDEPLMSRKH